MGESGFSERFGELVDRCERVGCGLGVVRRAACLVVGPVIVGGYASLFSCASAVSHGLLQLCPYNQTIHEIVLN